MTAKINGGRCTGGLQTRVNTVAHDNITSQGMLAGYKEWADTFDEDNRKCNYTGPTIAANYMCKCFTPEERSTVKVIDVGAGTGLVGEELRKVGFENVDGLDPSRDMLDKARDKNVYRNYFYEFLTEEQLDIPGGAYDAVVGSGIYMEAGHVPTCAIREMVRLVRPGGYVVLVTRTNLLQEGGTYADLEPLMERLVSEGKWRLVERDIGSKLYLDKISIVWRYQVV